MSYRSKIFVTLFALFCVLSFFYAIRAVLFPFIMAFVLSYLLDPVVGYLSKSFKLGRSLSALIVVGIFFTLIILALSLMLPVVYDQVTTFIAKIPEYREIFESKIMPKIFKVLESFDPEIGEKIINSIENFSGEIFKYLKSLLSHIWSSGSAFLHILSLVFITPLVMYYILRDFHEIAEEFHKLIPSNMKKSIRKLLQDIDNVLSGYIRGQFNVCLMLGVFYATGLIYIGLDYGLFIGLGTGLASFIPYFGMLVGAGTGIIVALVQYPTMYEVMLVVAVFVIGQAIEGNFVTPKIVGNKIGLHPVWMIFAMLAAGLLFGFVGVLIAIPLAAIISVIVRHIMELYFNSEVYKGRKIKKARA